MGWIAVYTLFERETLRYIRNWKSSVLPPLITNFLYIVVFGSILGARISEIQGFSYIDFILPGLILLGATLNAFENTGFSIFHSRWDNYINELLTSPMAYWEMLLAYIAAAVTRGVIAGIGILGVALLFTDLTLMHPLYFGLFLVLSTTLFASFGVIVGLGAREFGDLSTFSNFLITPFVFFGGVFYSLEMLPGIWHQVSLLNPMVYMVNGLRYGMLSYSDVDPVTSFLALIVVTAIVILVDVHLFRIGYGLRE